MHAGKGLYTSCAGKHGGRYKTNFISLKPVLAFQTLTQAMLGKWATTHQRVFFLDFAAWLDLTSNADNTITVYQLPSKFRTHFDSLKHADDLRVYEGFMMPLNHRAGIEGTLKQC